MVEVPKEKIDIVIKPVVPDGEGFQIGSSQRPTGAARDAYFEYLDAENQTRLLRKAAVGHVPLPLSIGSWGFFPSANDVAENRLSLDYIRIWQPQNNYTDMEPVYQ